MSTPTPTQPPSGAQREAGLTAALVFGALALGAVLQIWIPPGPATLVAAAALAGAVVLVAVVVFRGHLRQTLAGFRFTSTLLIALALFAVIGTLVLQGKPAELYRVRYGPFGSLILALRLDDIFHGLPFAGLAALFYAAVISSASLRWPISAKRAGFFVAHLGLLTSMTGAAASSVLSVRGRIDLFAGGSVARDVRVTKNGVATGQRVPLGFDLTLDQFDLVNYETEFRIGYYEKVRVTRDGRTFEDYRLKTSFDPDTQKHRLPSGDSFRLTAVYPDFAPQPLATAAASGPPAARVTLGGETRWLFPGDRLETPDGRYTAVFDWERPAPPQGALTAFLLSGKDGQVVVHTGDGDLTQPLVVGAPVAGGLLVVREVLEHATRTMGYATRSDAWRNPAAILETTVAGQTREQLVLAAQPRGVFLRGDRNALVFEKRDKEVKAFLSHVTARSGGTVRQAIVAVNEPFDFAGWTLYQVNYNPEDPSYSGLEAVRDPGVAWVFLGFVLICVGVFYMFYFEPRLRGGGIQRPGTPGPTSAGA